MILVITSEFALSPILEEVATSSVLVGAVLGAIAGGFLSDRIGQRPSIIAASAVFLAGTGIVVVAPDLSIIYYAPTIFQNLLARASPLGLYAEEIQPATGTHMGNFPRSFSQIGIINAAVSLAHAGHIGTVSPHHAAVADAAGHGGGGKRSS